jgi:thiol:disulfide interchange protein
MMRRYGLFVGFCLFLQMLPLLGQNEVTYSLRVQEAAVVTGGSFQAVLRAELADGWHLYSMTQPSGGPVPTTITVSENPVFSLAGAVVQPEAIVSFDENFGIDTEYFEGNADFVVPVAVSPQATAGKHALTVRIRFMLCSDTVCLPPQTKTLTADVTVTSAAGRPAAAVEAPRAPGTDPTAEPAQAASEAVPGPEIIEDLQGAAALPARPDTEQDAGQAAAAGSPEPAGASGFPLTTLAYVWFAMAMGGLALLTPCVFPMIPITVSYFTKRQAVSRRRAVGEAAMYSAGIIGTFTLLGFALTFLFGAGGINRLAASPLVNLFIALIFIVFALSLFGAIELRVPSSWLTAVDRRSSKTGGVLGIMLMALTFSLTSFTCTVPFVGTVMVAALQGDLLWSVLGVASFALVFSAPFFLLALFPSILQSLPRSGNWMNSVKIVMGFLELAAALKFISNVDLVYQWEIITRPVFITVWLAIALLTTVYLLGWFRFPHEAAEPAIGSTRVLSAVFFLSISFYLLRGLFGFPLGELDAFLPPRDYGNTGHYVAFNQGGPARAAPQWHSNYQQGLQQARAENRPIFLDFTGYTCTNCRWMEANIFPLPEVQDLFGRFVLVRLYTDGNGPEYEANLRFEQERFGTIALPFYAIISPQDETLATFPGLTRNRLEFIEFLRGGLGRADYLLSQENKPVPLAEDGAEMSSVY